ncbi:S8 family serine peptidase [Actinophytocola oryzae]|uniref:Subtilase family protein n=1 Tax=Actinophytocola oryzae TaxID=502181 RepID=A0A4V3FSE7_9PSEU|nr:S8 family serine peptidase [Actinophytocola oryzae]TDV47101.1 subtilase family protein [Actinophytocola oryzae]
MTQRESRRRGIGAVLTAAALGISLTAALPSTIASADPSRPPDAQDLLGKQDRDLLIQAKEDGKSTVTVMVLAKDGQTNQTVDQLENAGAKIEYRADEINYVRAEIPVDKVETAAKASGLRAFDLDKVVALDNPRPQGIDDPDPQPAPGKNTPRVNPYMPTGDTSAAEFAQQQNNKFDGRGVTVGIIDSGVDLGHPSLNTTSTGEKKIVDWVTATDPGFTDGVNNDDDPTWIDMSNPAPGQPAQFRYGVFNERDPRLGGELGNDVNRDGNPAGSIGTFGVLWDTSTNTVWVDTNQNKSFADDKPMTDYKVANDQGEFGHDNPATPIRESMPFVVQTDPAHNTVNIGIVSGEHGSHVAGIVAGNSLFGGKMNGAAPGAKLVSVRICLFVTGCTAHAMMEGMRYAAQNGVDVINMSVGGLGLINDGEDDDELFFNELIDEYNVQIFISAGNDGPGANTASQPSLGSKIMSVGSYITKASWQANYGSNTIQDENLHPFSGRGPTEAGGFKPDIVAPGSAISTIPTWMPGGPVVGTYNLPPGYAMLQGTSMASPQAAGAAALLVGAAKLKGVSHRPDQLRTAMKSSARFLTNYQAYEQGNGLIDVPKAWNLLKNDIKTTTITSSVPVNTVLSSFIRPTPGIGIGIYDREGVKAGDRYTREYTFKRTSGPSSPTTYNLQWMGNDGTFTSAGTILLPLNSAVKYRVSVTPRTAGIHSAILELDSPLTTGIEYQTMNTVVAAEDFTAGNGYTIKHSGQVGRNDFDSYFVRVPANTPALKVDLQGGGDTPGAGQVRFLRFHPYGVPVDDTQTPECYNPPVPPGNDCNGGESPRTRTYANPTAGVWEIVVEARRTSDAVKTPYTVSIAVLGATVSPNPDVIASAPLNQPVARQYTLKNEFGPFTGRAVGTTLGSAKVARPTIADGAQAQFAFNVTAGATQVTAKIGNPSDKGSDLDLFLYFCGSGTCVLAGQSADGDAEEAVTINNPPAGQWLALVDGFAVPDGTTEYDYLDVFTNPAFGNVAITDANAERAAGSSWTVSGVVTAKAAPAAGRVLLGNVEVRTDEDILVGSGDVIVQSVA